MPDIAHPETGIEKFAAEIPALKTQFDIFRLMRRITEGFGARGFLVLNLPDAASSNLSANSVITSWPAELLASYDAEGMLKDSPVIRRLRSSTVPFRYDVEEINADRADGKELVARNLFIRHGLTRGAYFPVHEFSGTRGAISFSGDRTPFTDAEMRDLAYLSTLIYDHMAAIRTTDERVSKTLTDREIDCLTWTAAGKTSAEIAEILGLSEHTINHYLNRATKKLDTVNRTQAVVKAMRTGIIR